ncbi:MAG: crossover junction endodeoxyribonuclease RuvC [Proteobacteria bacterium]|nr:crossover junction endodeoxyribonuclease RuvC [Pseudomonadota bacterium]
MILLGLDPGLQRTGWGVIASDGVRLGHLANGVVATNPKQALAERLVTLYDGLVEVVSRFEPDEACVEETFVNRNFASALKLGQARGIALLVPAHRGLPVAEYAPNLVKKSVVGAGHADKSQIDAMVRMLLPGCNPAGPDAADALAVAICHAHHAWTGRRIAAAAR